MKTRQIIRILTVATAFLSMAVMTRGETINFNADWRFIKADPAGAEQIQDEDTGWQQVSAPHTYNDTDTFDNWSPSGHRGEMDQWGGRTWYRKTFRIPAEWRDKKVYLEFEAVRQIAEVYLNGKRLGRSQNGFIPFGFDLSDFWVPGEEQTLAVMCDNSFAMDDPSERLGGTKGDDVDYSKLAYNEGDGKQFPWNNPHWHPAHGGIYRNVFLHVKDPTHLTLPLFRNLGTVGSYSYASDISRESAVAHVDAEVLNSSQSEKELRVKTQWIDQNGQVVAETASSPQTVRAGEKIVIPLSATIQNPLLWEPDHPHVYQVHNRLFEGGTLLDEETLPLGIRTFTWTTHAGAFVNGRHVKFHGWGQKSISEWPGIGAAQPDWMHYFTLNLMHEAGGNIVRWGHTAGGPAQITSGDRLGILAIQPGVDGEGDVTGPAWDERLASFRDMVIYYRNHPSIGIWEGGNQSVSKDHVEALVNVVKTYDPHGGRAYAHRRANALVGSYCDLTISTEGAGYREDLPTVEGEYNREESPRRVWDDFSPPDFDYKGATGTYDLTSEQFAVNQIFQYDKIFPLFHGGGANWIFSDSTSGGRVQSEVCRTSGEVDAVRLPKEAYFVCRVLFTEEPDLHLIGHWTYPAGTVKNLYVATDCDQVELVLNGESLGRQSRYEGKIDAQTKKHPKLFAFEQVQFVPGTIEAIGYVAGQEVYRQKLETAGPAVALRLSPITGPNGFEATGSDYLLVDVEAVDAQGRRCPTWQQRVDFELQGPGIWRGGYNSGKAHSINNTWLDLEAGINRVSIRSTLESGEITLTAVAEGLPPQSITVPVRAVKRENRFLAELPALPPAKPLGPLPAPTETDHALMKDQSGGTRRQIAGNYIAEVAYSGAWKIAVTTAEKGIKLYSDDDLALENIPAVLAGADLIQLSDHEWNYSAVDLMQFEVTTNALVYIAHDARLQPLSWLKSQYTRCDEVLTIGPNTWTLWKRLVSAKESVLIGSNTETADEKRWQMAVFVVPQK